jgi:hypothetical protein
MMEERSQTARVSPRFRPPVRAIIVPRKPFEADVAAARAAESGRPRNASAADHRAQLEIGALPILAVGWPILAVSARVGSFFTPAFFWARAAFCVSQRLTSILGNGETERGTNGETEETEGRNGGTKRRDNGGTDGTFSAIQSSTLNPANSHPAHDFLPFNE